MGQIWISDVFDAYKGEVKVKYGKMEFNTTLPQSVLDDLRRKHQPLVRNIYVDHPNMGGEDIRTVKKRKDHRRIYIKPKERRKRYWLRGRMKLEIEWKLKGRQEGKVEVEEPKILDSDMIARAEALAVEFISVTGHEDATKHIIDGLKKFREPGKTATGDKESKDNFIPSIPYWQMRQELRKMKPLIDGKKPAGEPAGAQVKLERIEEVGYEKCIIHLTSGNLREYEKKNSKVTDNEWKQIYGYIKQIDEQPFVVWIKSTKVMDK